MPKVRVYQLAKELKVQSALILELLDRMGQEVKSDLSSLDPGVLFVDFGRVGGTRIILRDGLEAPINNVVQMCCQDLTAERGQAIVQLAGGLGIADGDFLDVKHGPTVEPGGHAHQANARGCVPGQDGRLDRRCAAPSRQDRCVHVHTAVRGNIEHGLRQYQPVGRNDEKVRP